MVEEKRHPGREPRKDFRPAGFPEIPMVIVGGERGEHVPNASRPFRV